VIRKRSATTLSGVYHAIQTLFQLSYSPTPEAEEYHAIERDRRSGAVLAINPPQRLATPSTGRGGLT